MVRDEDRSAGALIRVSLGGVLFAAVIVREPAQTRVPARKPPSPDSLNHTRHSHGITSVRKQANKQTNLGLAKRRRVGFAQASTPRARGAGAGAATAACSASHIRDSGSFFFPRGGNVMVRKSAPLSAASCLPTRTGCPMRGRSLRCPWRGIDFWTARIGNRVTRFSLHSFPNPTSHADACVLILVGLQGKHIVVRACKNPFCRRGMRKGGAAWQRSGPAARTLDLQDALARDAELFFATDAAAL